MPAKFQGALLVLALVTGVPAAAADPPPIFVGGAFIHEHAIQDAQGHLLVPVRGVFEAFGADVSYTPPRYVVVRKDGAVIAGLIVGSSHAVVGRSGRNLPVAPQRHRGRVYVPLRVIAELAGASVSYSARPRLVDIRVPDNVLGGARTVLDPQIPPDPATPVWAYVLVGGLLLGLLVECARRLAAAAHKPAKRRRYSGPRGLVARPPQLPYAADTSDQHGVG
jgi:hypothetical protein